MTHFLKRLTALLLCLCLLAPCLAAAEDAHGVSFTLQAEMFPEAYPEEDRALLEGLSGLINILSFSGTYQYDEDCIDLNADVLLDGAEETRTSLRVYGNEAYWGVQSSLFGDQELSLNLQALLEFCMKAYFHLEIPLQRVGLFVTPYVHKDGLGALTSLWNPVMNATSDSRTIDRDTMLSLARQLSSVASSDRAFTYWVQALALEAGYDGAIADFLDTLPEWADEILGEDGVTIVVDGDNETWSTGGTTLFSRTVEDGWTTLKLSLPPTLDGYEISGFCTVLNDGATLSADARLTVSQENESILDLRLSADNLPQVIPASGEFSLRCDITGEAAGDGLHLVFEGESTDGVFSLQQKDAASGKTMLVISGSAVSAEITSPLNWTRADLTGLEFFSVSDVTLSQFIKDVYKPLISGLFPLLVHAPMEACQTLMDLVTDTGIFDVLTSSASSVESIDEEAWDEEDWDEEYWDEESWDDIDWDDESLYDN